MRKFLTLATVLALAHVVSGSLARAAAPTPPELGYRIEVELTGFSDSVVYLANYFLDKQYIVDTAAVERGRAVFTGDEPLPEGMYLLVLPPDNDFVQVLVDGDQQFSLRASADDLTGSMQVKGSDENERFFAYLHLLDGLRPVADSLRVVARDSSLSAKRRADAQTRVDALDASVKAEQARIMDEYPRSILASLLRSFEEPAVPTFAGSEEEIQRQKYLHYKAHYFDNVDLGDPRALRSTYLDQRVSYYLDKLVVPVPDSINKEIDYVLGLMRPAPETFRAYVSKFLNQYATSKIVGQDAVYAHLGEKYYMGGQTPWVDSTTLTKIADNVKRLKPLLIGQPAPPLKTYHPDGSPHELYSVDADYTVVFFFDPECGVCKKQTPQLIEFAQAYADMGVKVVSVCTKLGAEARSCAEYAKDKEGMVESIINTNDPFHRSGFKVRYDITSTPQIYVLDRDKRIVSKRIAADQLAEIMDRLFEMEEARRLEGSAAGK